MVVEVGSICKARRSLPACASTGSAQKKLVWLILFVVGSSTVPVGSSEGFVLPRIVSSVPAPIAAPAIYPGLLKVRDACYTNLILWPAQSALHTRHIVRRSAQRREPPYQFVGNDTPSLQLSLSGSIGQVGAAYHMVDFKHTREHLQAFNLCCKRALKGAWAATENVAETQLLRRILAFSHLARRRLTAITNRR